MFPQMALDRAMANLYGNVDVGTIYVCTDVIKV